MGRIEDLAAVAGVVLLRHGALALLTAPDAVRLVEVAGASGVRVLGAEGFWVFEDGVRPDMGSILDLSSVAELAGSVSAAIAISFFDRQVDASLMFDVVLDETTT
jgi:hypothetical protein